MWGGVLRGLAGVKLSGSPRRSGENRTREVRINPMNRSPIMSLIV